MTRSAVRSQRDEHAPRLHPEMPRCMTCRFADIHPLLMHRNLGFCTHTMMVRTGYLGQPTPFQLPGLDFGCVLHEPHVCVPEEVQS